MKFIVLILVLLVFAAGCGNAQSKKDASKLVSYNKLSQDAIDNGYLYDYGSTPKAEGELKIGKYNLRYSVPSKVRAYDMVPIEYTLNMPAGERRCAFEAVSFEDPDRCGGKAAYDMAIPGNMRVKLEYLGSVSGDYEAGKYPYLQKDAKAAEILKNAPIKRDPLVRSGVIRAADCIWFKFRLTNTGNTILDPEGFGAGLFMPWLMQVDNKGKNMWQHQARPINLVERHLGYIYPGESYEFWTQFDCSSAFGWPGRQLREGKFVLTMEYAYRINKTYDYWTNVWGAMPFQAFKVYFDVEKEPRQTNVRTEILKPDTTEKMPDYVSSFEEFMTSFDYYRPETKNKTVKKTMYLQIAPWTKTVTLKLMLTDPQKIDYVRIPVEVVLDHLKIPYNPDNQMVITENGKEIPCIAAQAMPGMRINFQLGPDVEERMLREAKDMKDMGVNTISNTAGGYWYEELDRYSKNNILEPLMIGYRYWYDYCMREAGLHSLGWSVYPGTHGGAFLIYNNQHGTDLKGDGTYTDPNLPKAVASLVKYCYDRWGENWVTTKDGRMPIEMEDSWGWMRYDLNTRFETISPETDKLFQDWAVKKYGSLAAINKAWAAIYRNIDEIKPTEAVAKLNRSISDKEKRPRDFVFYDWSPAMEDYDTFRTEQRMAYLDRVNKELQKLLPNAELSVRTEGGILIAKGDKDSNKDADLRHIYYSQRRQALMYNVIKEKDILHYYTDYTTIAYTPTVFRQACRDTREAGVTTWYLMQFDHMREIVLNDTYGEDYTTVYNLPKDAPNKKGMMMHVLAAAYPLWRICYEEGQAPGIIWADYLCDGFATETQKQEIRVLRDNLPVRDIQN